MKLYMNAMSPNVRRVRMTAAVLGLQLEEKPVDFAKGEHKSADFLALNPNGAVPLLVDGDFALTESRAIMQYLASKKPESSLLPRDEKARADVARWMFWDAIHFSPHVGTLAFQRVVKRMFGMGDPDVAKVEEALVNFGRFGSVLDKQLAGKRYVLGDVMTLPDITLASSLMYAKQSDLPLADHANMQAWFGRMTELEAWKTTAE